jgi:CheY-like chemotaxis protein
MAFVMIVDDDADFANSAATVLRHAGHEVRIELDSHEAIARMEERRPDLVILDVMFPESASAGFDLAQSIQHDHPKLKDMPILMLTAINEKFPLGFGPQDIDQDWLPIADFLEKPVDLEALLDKVHKLLAQGVDPGAPPPR